MSSRHTSRTAPAVAIAVLGLLLTGATTPASAAPAGGKLKGTVTLDGAPITNARVQLFRNVIKGDEASKPVRLKTYNTDATGRYSFSSLAVKGSYNYTLLVTDRSGRTVKTFRNVDPKAGRTVTKNVRMKAAGILSGTIARADGGSPAELTVGVDLGIDRGDAGPDFDAFFPDARTSVKADGTFTLSGLPSGAAGTYADVQVSGGPYAEQCYDLVAGTLADCKPADRAAAGRQQVTLGAGETRTLPAVTVTKLVPAVTRVTGQVTDTSGKALKGVEVTIAGNHVTTRSSGRYTVEERIPAGSYTVRFDDPEHVWASQYLGGGPDKSVRQSVTVVPGQPVKGLDTRLKSIATTKLATKAGKGSAKVAFLIQRKATGSFPSGTLTLSYKGISKKVTVTEGRATVTLTGLPKGVRSLTADYSGTSSTAGFSKTVKVMVK